MKVIVVIGIALLVWASVILLTDSSAITSRDADTSYVALLERVDVPGQVNEWARAHSFEAAPDGGRIVMANRPGDMWGTETIRVHMREIGARFTLGNFSIPGIAPDPFAPGIDVMAAKRDVIQYVADTLPLGGMLRIVTADSVAIINVHAFMAFLTKKHGVPPPDTAAKKDSTQ